ncbi:hypothetical protein OUZ56_028602 [Daphnia magna]|uniref:Uncharacterized protein n=1 Tax=Daphnia magna TaxID=35525 RepID=A0ABR0B4E3_9CRUS|nr:hypothetical protein OUZ56_028602 [Daphnia magna]
MDDGQLCCAKGLFDYSHYWFEYILKLGALSKYHFDASCRIKHHQQQQQQPTGFRILSKFDTVPRAPTRAGNGARETETESKGKVTLHFTWPTGAFWPVGIYKDYT